MTICWQDFITFLKYRFCYFFLNFNRSCPRGLQHSLNQVLVHFVRISCLISLKKSLTICFIIVRFDFIYVRKSRIVSTMFDLIGKSYYKR